MFSSVKNSAVQDKPYSTGEEIAHSVTHGVGAALAVAGLVILVVLAAWRGDAWRVVSFSIYGTTLFLLYLASTLYHAFPWPRVKRIFKVLDHVSIYLLIAGTYTPICLVAMRGPWGWTLFGLIWGLAIGGIVLKTLLIGRAPVLSVVLYIAMGWLAVVAVKPMGAMMPKPAIAWIFAGGLFYTLGVVFYVMKRVRYHHAVWHGFVLGGSVCHFFAMMVLA
jgi:hemolysin III